MLEIIGIAGIYVAGLIPAVTFIIGFLARRRLEDTGRVFGKTNVPEPFLNTSKEAEVEQRRAEAIDLATYENE
jgi:hypothetical protein